MAHFARLDENNVVIGVVVVSNEDCMVDGVELEQKGIEFLQNLFGEDSVWKQTSYNNNIRKRYAGIGFTYRSDIDAFIHPQPYPSWLLNNETAEWEAPIPMPNDGQLYCWNEANQNWEVVIETISEGNSDGN